MAKLRTITKSKETVGYSFWCPGCQERHYLYCHPHRNSMGASWRFNGDLEHPTFTPSVLSTVPADPDWGMRQEVCHLFLTEGELRFLSDCTHELASQTVPLADEADIHL